LRRAGIPTRYEHCTLDNFDDAYPGADRSLAGHSAGARLCRQLPTGFTRADPGGIDRDRKDHLAVGALKAVIAERGAQGLFCDYRELLRLIQNSYNPEVSTTELEILNPS